MAREIIPINKIATVKLIKLKHAPYPAYLIEFPVRNRKLGYTHRVAFDSDIVGSYSSNGKSLEEGNIPEDIFQPYVNKDNGFTSPLHMWEFEKSLQDWECRFRHAINHRSKTVWYNVHLNSLVYELYRWLTHKCSTNEGYAELFPDRTLENLGCEEEQLIIERMNRVTMWWMMVQEHLPHAGPYEYNLLITGATGIPLPRRFRQALKRFVDKVPNYGYENINNILILNDEDKWWG